MGAPCGTLRPGRRRSFGTWSSEVRPSYRLRSKSRRAERGGSMEPECGLLRNHHVHRLPMGHPACVRNELQLPRVQDLPVPVIAQQLSRAERRRKRIRRLGWDVGFRYVGVHCVDSPRSGARFEVFKSGRPNSTREVIQGTRAKHYVHSMTQSVGPNVRDQKSSVDPETGRPALRLSDAHTRDIYAQDPIASPGKVDRVSTFPGTQVDQRAGRARK